MEWWLWSTAIQSCTISAVSMHNSAGQHARFAPAYSIHVKDVVWSWPHHYRLDMVKIDRGEMAPKFQELAKEVGQDPDAFKYLLS
jgi:hypothetical protein